jgi:hypothetical protein
MMNLGLFYDCSQSLNVSQQLKLFRGWGRQPLFVWIITFDLRPYQQLRTCSKMKRGCECWGWIELAEYHMCNGLS